MIFNKFYALAKLIRLNQPIGFFLLLWPTLWALWLAGDGSPDLDILIIFILGVFLMRSAGCIFNDCVDKDIDKLVKRTKNRPLLCGIIDYNEAIVLFIILICISFFLVLILCNTLVLFFSVIALILTCIYPYLKRYFYIPQVILGILFSWPIPMVFITINELFNKTCWLLFLTNVIWTILYDTQYAMLDREDDLRIGVKSTAILFGKYDKYVIGLLQIVVVVLLFFIGVEKEFKLMFYIALVMVSILFIYQQKLIISFNKNRCFRAFLYNNYIGLSIFIGILFG